MNLLSQLSKRQWLSQFSSIPATHLPAPADSKSPDDAATRADAAAAAANDAAAVHPAANAAAGHKLRADDASLPSLTTHPRFYSKAPAGMLFLLHQMPSQTICHLQDSSRMFVSQRSKKLGPRDADKT